MKDTKSHGVEGKSRAEILQYLEKAEDRVEAKWHEENHRNFKMLGVEETRQFLRRQGWRMIDLDIESAAANSLERIRMSQPKHHRQILAKIERLRRFINPPARKKCG